MPGNAPQGLFEVEVAQWLFHRLPFGFLQRFFKLASQHVFFFLLGFPRFAEFIFPPLRLFLKNPPSLADVHVRGGFGRRFVRENHGELRSEEHTSELQSPMYLVCRLLLEKKKSNRQCRTITVATV